MLSFQGKCNACNTGEVETGGSHEHYEYFRSYFSGGDRAAVEKRMALLDKLGSSDSVESFVGEALKDSGDTVAEPTYFPLE